MRTFTRWYTSALANRPRLVRSFTAGSLVALSDFLAQWLHHSRSTPTATSPSTSPTDKKPWYSFVKNDWDARQSMLLGIYGACFVAPFAHRWYRFLDSKIPLQSGKSTAIKSALKRTLLDQISVAPLFSVGFFVSRGVINGKRWKDIRVKIEQDFFKLMGGSACVWIPFQFVNFFFIPLHYRVVFSNVVGLSWSTLTNLTLGRFDSLTHRAGPNLDISTCT